MQVLFCQTNVPFYWYKEPFLKNSLIQFFILKKQFPNFSFEIILARISHI